MPAVSTRIRSKSAACSTRTASATARESARCARRVASERAKMPGPWIAFMRMRSPSSAPPERRRVGSTSSRPMLRSGCSSRKRQTISSTTLDLPEPPVPVKPTTGAGGAPAARLELAAQAIARRARGLARVLELRDQARHRERRADAELRERILGARAADAARNPRAASGSCPRARGRGRPRGGRSAPRRSACSSAASAGVIVPPPPP